MLVVHWTMPTLSLLLNLLNQSPDLSLIRCLISKPAAAVCILPLLVSTGYLSTECCGIFRHFVTWCFQSLAFFSALNTLLLLLLSFAASSKCHWEQGQQPEKHCGGFRSWSCYRRQPSANVEITAYGLLANMQRGRSIGDSLCIAKWLVAQRNSRGGFTSTQVRL